MEDVIDALNQRKKRRKRLVLFGIGITGLFGLLVPIIILGSNQVVQTLDSTSFCQSCHQVHDPEAATLEVSAHAEVSCASCHVGTGTQNLVRSKLSGLKDVIPQLTHSYSLPIKTPLNNRRPSSETCEKCHYAEKFYGDIPQIQTTYASDEQNTRSTVTHVLKVGGGLPEVADGIHWHSTAQVWYVAVDPDRKRIAWVASENVSGTTTEYVDPELIKQLTPDQIESQKRLMDCVDCHNRTPHDFQSPDQLIDKAISNGGIDAALPFIKREALKALVPQNSSLDEATAKIAKIPDFYRTAYPSIYQAKKTLIDKAVASLKEIAKLTTFENINSNTYSDNSKHDPPDQSLNVDWQKISTADNSAGCFRCHGNLAKVNGKGIEQGADVPTLLKNINTLVVSSNVTSSGNATSSSAPKTPGTVPPTTRPIGPLSSNATALSTSGPAASNNVTGGGPGPGYLNANCDTCHYTYKSDVNRPVAPATPHPIDGLDDCLICHAPGAAKPFKSTHPWATNEACSSCHQSAPKLTSIKVSAKPSDAKPIPHSIEKLSDCLVCHAPTAPNPLKKDHPWATNDTCTACHDQASSLKPMPSPAPPSAKTIPHPINNLEQCLACHSSTGIKPIANSHPWATNETCQACHALSSSPLGLSSLPLPAATPVSHPIPGGFACTSCHGPSGPVPYPGNHAGLPESFCGICHKSSAPPVTTSAPMPQAPLITHQLPGNYACTSCHKKGGPGPFPADHTGVTDGFCQICHKPGTPTTGGSTPTGGTGATIDAAAIYSTYCASCHGTNRQGGLGPALTTTALSGLTTTQISTMTANGIGTMSGYSSQLTSAQIGALSTWLKGSTTTSDNTTPTPPASGSTPGTTIDAAGLYSTYCASCHGAGRQGGIGPALTTTTLSGLTVTQMSNYTANGIGTMPGYSSQLTSAQIDAISTWLKGSTSTTPTPSPTPTPPPPPIAHATAGYTLCLTCHGSISQVLVPADHAGRTNSTCTTCHQSSGVSTAPILSVGAPNLGHALDTQHQDCLSCHGPGKSQPFPSSHAGYQNLTCLVCHRTSSTTTRSGG